MKKIIIISVSVLLVVLVAISIIGWCIFGSNITSANSVEKLRDELYALEFKGDYSFDEFLSEGGAATDEELGTYIQKFLSKGFFNDNTQVNENKYGCSTMTVRNSSGEQLMGRNFD